MNWDRPADFKKLFKTRKNVVIVTHWSPDGDAMGSSLALYHYLKLKGHAVHVIVPNSYPDFLHWLPGDKQVLNFSEQEEKCRKVLKKAEVLFTLDFNTYARLEKLGDVLGSMDCPKILIDHHQQPDSYPTLFFHDEKASSTCELIFRLISQLGDEKLIDKKIATCLYTGLMTDTGSFRYSSVTAETHKAISVLMKTGIRPSDIHSAVYDSYSEKRIRLLGYALSQKMKLVDGVPAAYFVLSAPELEKYHYVKGDLEGIVNYPFMIRGIQVCAMISESEGQIKMSFRSKGNIDMNVFARKYFNGGGHINAAGGRSKESLEATEKTFREKVRELF